MSNIPKEKKQRGRPVGSRGDTHRFNRGLAAYVRERISPELYVEFQLAILQGWDPIFVKDERCTSTGGFRIEHREGGPVPGLDMKDRAMTNLRQAAWGLPAQQVQIDAQVRQQSMISIEGLDTSDMRLGVQGRAELIAAAEAALGRMLSPGVSTRGTEVEDAADAEFQDVNVRERDEESEGSQDGADETIQPIKWDVDVDEEQRPHSPDAVG